MNRRDTRTPLHRAMGLGSAKDYTAHWWSQRVSAVALVPLLLWFTASLIALAGGDYQAFIAWLQEPLTTILMVLLLIALFRHTVLGLEVIVEDYIHSRGLKVIAIVLIQFSGFALAVAGILAILSIAFGR